MNITPVEQIPTAIDLAVNMRAHLLQLRTTFTKPFLVIIYEHRSLLRPTYALIQPAANFNLATVRGHVLPSFQPHLNYFNNTKAKITKEELCNIANHICNKLHTQLIRFDKICCICVGTTIPPMTTGSMTSRTHIPCCLNSTRKRELKCLETIKFS